ncbi:MAG: hypothetical protein RLZZ628_2762, partial [Bacteroidota bacterium]
MPNHLIFQMISAFFFNITSVERIGTRMTRILRIYTDFFLNLVLKSNLNSKKIRVN